MKKTLSSVLLGILLAACGGAPPAPPALEYRAGGSQTLSYDVESRAAVAVSLMGQSMELTQEGTATYALDLAPTAGGIDVSMRIAAMNATLSSPMGAPVRIDEGAVDGMIRYTIDRMGNATVSELPTVQAEASQMVSGSALAHNFLPGLPGTAVRVGDRWVDTVTYEGDDGAGPRSETSVLEYVVAADTVVDGRSLLHIDVTGTVASESTMSVGGMSVSQTSELDVEGFVLWDWQEGIMVESARTGTGRGTVAVPQMPGPLPIRLDTNERTTLQGR